MFRKRECEGCRKKISEKHNFCPHCGSNKQGKKPREDFGMLGENDYVNEFENFSNSLFGGVGGKVMGKMLENAMKVLEKEMGKEMKRKKSKTRSKNKFSIIHKWTKN